MSASMDSKHRTAVTISRTSGDNEETDQVDKLLAVSGVLKEVFSFEGVCNGMQLEPVPVRNGV